MMTEAPCLLFLGDPADPPIPCREPTRKHMRGLPGCKPPSRGALPGAALGPGRVANPAAQVAAFSLITRLRQPATDPFRFGAGRPVAAPAAP